MCYALRCQSCGEWVDEQMPEAWPGTDREWPICLVCDTDEDDEK